MTNANSEWEIMIGLEVHVQLNTRSKLFSRSPNENGTYLPNQNANLVDLGFPGTLPVLNQAALAKVIRFGLAIDAPVAGECVFDRKNYFYPDLPKGYQISQFYQPIVGSGMFQLWLVDGGSKSIQIRQAHLEEDAGKSIHDRFTDKTALDFNRAGSPLMEIVTEPELNSPQEAVACFRQLQALVVWLGLCSGNLYQGAIRCDANVSLRPKGDERFGSLVELKNLNSFKFLKKALRWEINRQSLLLSAGKEVQRETRMFDPATNTTHPMRRKDHQKDYRYFRDPDLPPIPISKAFIKEIAASMPELPSTRRKRFIERFGLEPESAYRLTLHKPIADLFEATNKLCKQPKTISNWILGELHAVSKLGNAEPKNISITHEQLAQVITRVRDGTISMRIGKELLGEIWGTELNVDQVIRKQSLSQICDSDQISTWVAEVLEKNCELVHELMNGEQKLYDYLIGQVMKISLGKANPHQVRKTLENHVFELRRQRFSDEIS